MNQCQRCGGWIVTDGFKMQAPGGQECYCRPEIDRRQSWPDTNWEIVQGLRRIESLLRVISERIKKLEEPREGKDDGN